MSSNAMVQVANTISKKSEIIIYFYETIELIIYGKGLSQIPSQYILPIYIYIIKYSFNFYLKNTWSLYLQKSYILK